MCLPCARRQHSSEFHQTIPLNANDFLICLDSEFLPGASASESDLRERGHSAMDRVPLLHEAQGEQDLEEFYSCSMVLSIAAVLVKFMVCSVKKINQRFQGLSELQ